MFELAAVLVLLALLVKPAASKQAEEPPAPKPTPPPAPPRQPDPDPPSETPRWDSITATNVKFRILARREVLIHWWNILWDWTADAIPSSGELTWEKSDLVGGIVTHVAVKLTPTDMQFCIYRTDKEKVVESNQYLVEAATVAKAIKDHDTKWFNGIAIWAGMWLDIIVDLQ